MTTPMPPAESTDEGLSRPAFGIGLCVIAIALFATMDALAKFTSEMIRVEMVIWGRYFFHFTAMVLMLPLLGVRRVLRTERTALVTVRGLLLLGCTICFFTAVSLVPLAEANAIGFVSPLITVAFSAFFLGEAVGVRRWSAVAIGFAGMLVILRPGFQEVHWAYFLVLAMAVMFSAFALLTRTLNRTEDPVALLFNTALVGNFGASLLIFFHWETPTATEWLLLMVIGAIGGISHQILIFGYRYASAAIVAPFQYTILIWSALYGFFLFGDAPDIWTFVGGGVIVAAGLYVWLRERKIKDEPTGPTALRR
ncbi:DMT family transporter [Nisaea acidiphila]|uniref:DMT family transporter n=1 Tax=Nisaea acidiphila TaxID=1862145 RepID=A0A9J7AR64_9PROT|nr:DMT family transporter [Nisaea acidiphila]UUX49735.1 DMT family transporter [Nisaea acidiphila]